MKKFLFFGVAIILISIILSVCVFYNKKYVVQRTFGVSIPKTAMITNFHHSLSIDDGETTAARIVLLREDYESMLLTASDKYTILDFTGQDYTDEDIIVALDSDYPVNLEKYDEDIPWWDLETEQITQLLHCETGKPLVHIRKRNRFRIYAVEMDDTVILYLYASR